MVGAMVNNPIASFLASRVFCKPCSLSSPWGLKVSRLEVCWPLFAVLGMTAAKWAYDPSLKIVLLLSLLPLYCWYGGEWGLSLAAAIGAIPLPEAFTA